MHVINDVIMRLWSVHGYTSAGFEPQKPIRFTTLEWRNLQTEYTTVTRLGIYLASACNSVVNVP